MQWGGGRHGPAMHEGGICKVSIDRGGDGRALRHTEIRLAGIFIFVPSEQTD